MFGAAAEHGVEPQAKEGCDHGQDHYFRCHVPKSILCVRRLVLDDWPGRPAKGAVSCGQPRLKVLGLALQHSPR
jgi:hypothetical protein